MFFLFASIFPLLANNTPTWLLLLTSVVIYIFIYARKKQSYWKTKGIPYVKPKFLLGNLVFGSKPLHHLIQDVYNAYPDERYHGYYEFLSPVVLIKDPDLLKQVTVRDFEHFMNHHSIADSRGDPFWSRNLFDLKGERWRAMRSTLSYTFSSSKLKIMYHLMEDCALQFVDHFKKQNQEVIEVEAKETVRRYTCDVVATTAFGLKCNSLENEDNEFYTMGNNVANLTLVQLLRVFAYYTSPTLAQFFKIRVFPKTHTDYFSKIIEDTIKTREEKNIVRPDMIHLMLEAQKQSKTEVTIEDINVQSFGFFVAGFETVSSSLTFILYELALNPDIQERLRAEIRSVQELTYENLQNLKYLDMVVAEALRKWPPFPATNREVTKDYTIEPVRSGERPLVLKKGMVVCLPIFALHRDARFFPDPEKFDPERFSDENRHKINPAVYMPFGAGPRSCVAVRFVNWKSKLLVYHILKNFQVVKVAKTPDSIVLDNFQINLTVKGGMWLGLKKID